MDENAKYPPGPGQYVQGRCLTCTDREHSNGLIYMAGADYEFGRLGKASGKKWVQMMR